MANYNYSLSGDFSNGINLLCLHKTIEAYGFPAPFNGINLESDVVTIMFTGALGTGDETDLNTIISNHNPDSCPEESDFGNVIGAAGDAESLSESSTNSSTPQRKLRMNITEIPEGRYRIGWYYEWAQSSQSTDFRARVQLNDTTDLMYHSQEAKDSGTDQSIPICGYAYVNLTEEDHTIDLDFWAEGNTSYIKNARLEIWRAV
jgi:hypothetical protein